MKRSSVSVGSSASILTLSSKQKEVEDFKYSININQNNQHAYFPATQYAESSVSDE